MSDTVASRLARLTVLDAEGRGHARRLLADRVRYEWRDRFAGDHAPMPDVVAALG
jgi:hypothetical protein